jgi:hypothetical protein
MVIPPESVQSLLALAFGFAVAAVLATGYQAATRRPPSFRLLQRGPTPWRYAAVPFLAFAAPFIIMKLILRAPRDRRRFHTVMTATIIAGIWSLMSGTVVVMALEALRQ